MANLVPSDISYQCQFSRNMTDVSTSSGTLQLKSQKCPRLVGWLISAIVCLMFLITAMAIAIVFSRSRLPKHTQKWMKMLVLEENPLERQEPHQTYTFTTINNYPFMAALVSSKPDMFLCSCAILNARHLLTAANCLSVLFPHLWVRIGTSFWDSDGELYEVKGFTIHHNYSSKTFDNNLAVVRTKNEMLFIQSVQLVELMTLNMSNVDGVLVGWGNVYVLCFFLLRN